MLEVDVLAFCSPDRDRDHDHDHDITRDPDSECDREYDFARDPDHDRDSDPDRDCDRSVFFLFGTKIIAIPPFRSYGREGFEEQSLAFLGMHAGERRNTPFRPRPRPRL
jgi:hypothetical protein